MGKTTESRNQNTQYQLSPGQQRIMDSATAQYMPGGVLPQGHASTAPFSDPSLQAFSATEANYGAQQPTMDAAKSLTAASAGPAGQEQGPADGWGTNPDGTAQYQDFATGVSKYMNPFVGDVINNGLGFLDTARQRQNLSTNNDSVAKGSFGGTRQAVRNSLDDQSYAAQGEKLISDNLNSGYDKAVGQYNTGFGQGEQALAANTGIEQGNRAAVGAAGKQLGDQAQQNQMITGNDINALGSVGGQIEAKDQAARDAEANNYGYGLTVASALEGLGPPPSSTSQSSTSVPSGVIWGNIGASAAGAAAGALARSDEQSKTRVEEADPHDALREIRKLAPKKFEYTQHAQATGSPAGRRTGFMAQDLEKATGRQAPRDATGYKAVDVADHLGRLTQAVQALDAKMRSKGKKAA